MLWCNLDLYCNAEIAGDEVDQVGMDGGLALDGLQSHEFLFDSDLCFDEGVSCFYHFIFGKSSMMHVKRTGCFSIRPLDFRMVSDVF